MTKEDFEILDRYKDIFDKLNNGATRIYPTLKMREDVTPVYFNVTGRKITRSEWNCSHCAFKAYKRLAEAYKEELERVVVETQPIPQTETETTVQSQIVKNKRGRKPKV